MSIRHLIACLELQDLYPETETTERVKLSPSHKLALAAIADDASDKSDHSFPGLEKVMRWSGTSKRRALDLLADLRAAGYLEQVSPGQPGRRAVYQIFIPARGPEPVDNSQIMGAESAHVQIMGAVSDTEVLNSAPLSLDTPQILNKSHRQPHLEGAEFSNGDDQGDRGIGGWIASRRRAKVAKHLDFDVLAERVAGIYADFDEQHRPELIRSAALLVVGKALTAGTRPADPTAYVAQSILNEPEVHRRRAFEQVVHL